MKEKLKKYYNYITRFSFYLFIFSLPWQTKIIIRAAESNFNEISFYISHILLLVSLILFLFYKIINKDKEEKRRVPFLWYFLLAFTFFVCLSFFMAPDKALAFHHCLIIILGTSLLYILQEGFAKTAYLEPILEKTKVLFVFLGSMFFHVFLGVVEFLNQRSFVCKYLGLSAHNPEELGVSVIENASGRWLRSYGGFDHPNIFAGVLVVSIIIAAYLLSKQKLIRTRKEVVASLFLFVFYFFSVVALLFTFSRSAWLSLVFGLLALFIFLVIKKEKWQLGRLMALFFFSLFLSGLIFFSYQDLFITRVEATGRLEQKSLTERSDQLSLNKGVVVDNFLLGLGIGNYNRFLAKEDLAQGVKKAAWEYQPVHNSFLLLLSESGMFSLIFFLALIFSIWYRGRHESFSWSLLISLIFLMMFDHWLLSLPFGIIFFFFVLGLI